MRAGLRRDREACEGETRGRRKAKSSGGGWLEGGGSWDERKVRQEEKVEEEQDGGEGKESERVGRKKVIQCGGIGSQIPCHLYCQGRREEGERREGR